jgi:hypothetical protein
MKESLQIQIPTPCREDWERMDQGEQGRFCQHCQKTVVDFTGMTDAEVLGYFGAGSHVCGRFLPGQLGRPLPPTPVQRNGWSGWRWVLASALMLLRPPEGSKPVKAVGVERRDSTVRSYIVESDGMIVHTTKRKKKVARVVADSVTGPDMARAIPVVNRAVASGEFSFVCRVGGVRISRVQSDSTILQKLADTVSAMNIFRKEDFVTLYPNPVERGGALHLAWLSGEGKYQLTLLSMRGQLVGERVVEVGATGQVDQWVLPLGLAAGVYVLRMVREGSSRVDVREVVVR